MRQNTATTAAAGKRTLDGIGLIVENTDGVKDVAKLERVKVVRV